MERIMRNCGMVLVAPMIMILMTSCTTNVTTDTASKLNYIKIDDTSCLSRSEKEQLVYNKCVIYKLKYGKLSKSCKTIIRSVR